MSENEQRNDEQADRLEDLLRAWGSDEAARRAEPPAAPRVTGAAPRRAAVPGPLLRWAPALAAAALLLAAVVTVFFSPGAARHEASEPAQRTAREAPPTTAPAAGEADGLRAERDRLKAELEQTAARLADARQKLASAITAEAHAAELQDLRDEMEAEKAGLLGRMSARIAGLNHALGKAEAALARRDERVAALTKELAGAREALATGEKARDAAAEEIAGLRTMHDAALAEARGAREDLSRLQAQLAALTEGFQRIYLGAVAAGEQGLAARQQAAEQARILERCAPARTAALQASTTRLLDQVEVVFTSLALLDPHDPRESQAFAALVRKSGLADRIQQALAAAQEPPHVEALLLEAKLILSGADRVG